MTREILFRGKRTNDGAWVYGDLLTKSYPITTRHNPPFILDTDGMWEVDPSTVGQFTGLHDKDGNKIFEGDIFQRNSVTGIVAYHRGCWFLEWEQNGITSRVILGDGDIASGSIIGHKITNP